MNAGYSKLMLLKRKYGFEKIYKYKNKLSKPYKDSKDNEYARYSMTRLAKKID